MRGGLMQPPTGPQETSNMVPESDTMDPSAGPDDYFGGAEEASPEEQAMYEAAMDAVWGMVYSDGNDEKILKSLKGAGEDLNAIGVKAGTLGLSIMQNLDGQLQSENMVMPESVRLEIATEVIEEILGLAEATNMIPTDDQSLEQLVTVAIDEMASKYGRGMAEQGFINPQASQALLSEMRGVAGAKLGMPPSAPSPMAQGVQQAGQEMV